MTSHLRAYLFGLACMVAAGALGFALGARSVPACPPPAAQAWTPAMVSCGSPIKGSTTWGPCEIIRDPRP